MDKYPVSALATHIEIGDLSLADCYPQIVEHGTEQNKHEVPRIVFRACLPPRLKDGEIFNFVSVDYVNETVDNAKDKLKEIDIMSDALYYIYVGKYKTLKTPVKTILTSRGFVPNDIVNTFFESKIAKQEYKDEGDFIQTYYNEETKTAIVIGSETSDYFWNVCAAVHPRIIPWYYNVKADFKMDEHPLNEDERALVRAVDVGDNEFIAAAQKIYDSTDVAEKVQAIKFRNMYRGVRTKLIANCDSTIQSSNNEFSCLERQIQEVACKIRDAVMQKAALEAGEDEDGAVLSKLFSRSNLAVKEWRGNELIFTAGANVVAFEGEKTETIIASKGCAIYSSMSGCGLTWEQAHELLKAVLVDREIFIPVYSNFKLSLENTSITVVQHNPPAPKFVNHIPHPHHEYYECTGTNLSRAASQLRDGNYVGAVNQVAGCVGTITLEDGAVMSRFAEKMLWKKSETPFMLPDGKKVNCVDAVKWLEANKAKEE